MRTSVTTCLLGALGALVGGWLVARWCLGLVLIAESVCAVVWGLLRDDGAAPQVQALNPARAFGEILERARRAP